MEPEHRLFIYLFIYLFTNFFGQKPTQREFARDRTQVQSWGAIPTQSNNQ